MNKNNIIKTNVEVTDNILLKEAFKEAIHHFNNKSSELKIIDKTERYKIKLSKKTGMPDMDLPSKYNI